MQLHAATLVLDHAQAGLKQHDALEKRTLKTTRCLKIAIVTETWPPEINGVALSILQLTKGLQKRGHKILLVRPRQNVRDYNFTPDQECLVKSQSIPKYTQLQFGWPQIFKIAEAFDQFKPDIVHIVTEGPLGLAALNQAKLRHIPVSSGFHSAFHDFSRYFDLAFLVKPLRQYLKWFHNQTDLTCVPSQDTRQVLRDSGLHCPMRVIGRGVDSQRFNPQCRRQALRQQWQADDDTTVLLSVGRVSPEKEVALIIKSYYQLKRIQKQRKFQLVVVGDGPALAEYQEHYPDVIFMGAQMGHALAECYASADVFAFPSQVETFGNVVLEAMASGLPVVAYNYACAGMMVDQQQSGWLIPLGDVAAWQQHIYDLPEQDTLRKMGHRAARQVEHCGWDKPISDFENALLQYAKKPMIYAEF